MNVRRTLYDNMLAAYLIITFREHCRNIPCLVGWHFVSVSVTAKQRQQQHKASDSREVTDLPADSPLYPELPDTPLDQCYQLQEISRIKKHLQDERDKRAVLYKKYYCWGNDLDSVDTTLLTASMGMDIRSMGSCAPLL